MTDQRPSESRRSSDSRIRPAVLAIVGLLGLAIVALAFWLASRPQTLPEVPRIELQLKEDKLYRLGEDTVPFTGFMLEHYDEGVLKSRSAISNGVLHGLSEGWHANGQIEVREHFKQGTSHGLRTKWHANGAKLSEVMVVDGQLHGTFRRWHENGKLAEEMELDKGTANGLARSFYPSGRPKAEATLKDGEVIEQKFWEEEEKEKVPAPSAP